MKKLRKSLVIKQQELADYLQVSRAALAMYETGKRTLPDDALLKLNSLQQALRLENNDRLTATAEAACDKIQQTEKESLQEQLLLLQSKSMSCAKKLQRMEKDYHSAMNLLHAIPVLLDKLQETESDKHERRCLLLMEKAMLEKLTQNHRGHQAALRAEQQALQLKQQQFTALQNQV